MAHKPTLSFPDSHPGEEQQQHDPLHVGGSATGVGGFGRPVLFADSGNEMKNLVMLFGLTGEIADAIIPKFGN